MSVRVLTSLFDQVVLRAGLHQPLAEAVIIGAGQHDHGRPGDVFPEIEPGFCSSRLSGSIKSSKTTSAGGPGHRLDALLEIDGAG